MPFYMDSSGNKVYYEPGKDSVINRIPVQATSVDAAQAEINNKIQSLRDAANSATLVMRGNMKLNMMDRVSIIVRRKDGNGTGEYRDHFTTGTYLVKSKNDLIEGSFTSTYELVKLSSSLNYQGVEEPNYTEVDTEGEQVLDVSVTGEEKGIAIAQYACEFVNKVDYVWGGTSLGTPDNPGTGVDCSGFTLKVFEKFGVQLPHSAKEQGKYGKEIHENEIMPGDIVCYAQKNGNYHVSIYIGNGAIVHAPQKGKKISTKSPWNYRQVTTIRRLW